MNETVKKQILDKITEYGTVIICRHTRPDGDAVGSTMGLKRILELSFPEKRVFLDNADYSDYVAFLGDEGERPSDEDYENALVIAVDTGTESRISNPRFSRGKTLIKIDHHIDDKPFGDVSWVEEERSSACEMITDFYITFRDVLKIDAAAATCLYAGMVTDSGRFYYRGTNADTLRCAAVLLEAGVDTEFLFSRLYIEDPNVFRFRADLAKRVKFTENGVAWLYISDRMRKRRGLSQEEASNSVSVMSSIKGSLIWLAFIENADGSIRVRLRSRFVEVQELATHYHGGGHACASGATVYGKGEMKALLADADALLKKYKSENEGWI
ncbi:MAG: bifunctional oligoribonuclease/PAP phosphatase NrnA [Clostridia bacterium]|nr:bifunctional oligoribonuclease/PAP phosphatase NrnA [Clostridia bacterium]